MHETQMESYVVLHFTSPLLILKICGNLLTHDLVVKNYAMFNDDSVATLAFLKIFFIRICAPKSRMLWTITSLQSSLPSPPSDYPHCSTHNRLYRAAPTQEYLPL